MELEKELTPEQEDVISLQTQLEKTHFDPYRHIEKQTLTDSLQKATEAESEFFQLAVQESLALLRDAHTRVSEEFRQEELFPVRYTEVGGNFYIIGAENKDSNLLGRQLLKINKVALRDILPSLANLSSKENSEVLAKDLAWFLESNKILRYCGFSHTETVQIDTDQGVIELKASKDKDTLYKMNPLLWSKHNKKENKTYEGNNLYQFRMEEGNLIFQYNDCTNEGFTEEYLERFKAHLLESSKDARNIVVDFRLNDGGSTEIMADLFERFPNNKPIYVAIARKTFSATIHHLLYLKQNKSAVLVGENAGQRPNRFGDYKEIVLPNSGIKVACSYKYFELLPGQDIDVIKPDIGIPVTIEDYKNNTDPLNKWITDNLQK